MRDYRLISTRYPYLPVTVWIGAYHGSFDAFVDTGFDGYLLIPVSESPSLPPVENNVGWILADGSRIVTPVFEADVQLGAFAAAPAYVVVLGDQAIIGRALLDDYSTTFDHGRRIIVER